MTNEQGNPTPQEYSVSDDIRNEERLRHHLAGPNRAEWTVANLRGVASLRSPMEASLRTYALEVAAFYGSPSTNNPHGEIDRLLDREALLKEDGVDERHIRGAFLAGLDAALVDRKRA